LGRSFGAHIRDHALIPGPGLGDGALAVGLALAVGSGGCLKSGTCFSRLPFMPRRPTEQTAQRPGLGNCVVLPLRSGLSDTHRPGIEGRKLGRHFQRIEGQCRKRQNARQYLVERLDLLLERSRLRLGSMLLRLNMPLLPGFLPLFRKPCLLSLLLLNLPA
jgi:hypothetical protein